MTTNGNVSRPADAALGYLLLRLTLGMNIMMHGLARILSGESKFVGGMMQTYTGSPLPHGLLLTFFYFLPWFEATVGFLVLIGLFTRVALTGGALLMTVLTFGVAMRQNWETASLQLSYALVFALMMAFVACNRYSIDGLRRGKTAES